MTKRHERLEELRLNDTITTILRLAFLRHRRSSSWSETLCFLYLTWPPPLRLVLLLTGTFLHLLLVIFFLFPLILGSVITILASRWTIYHLRLHSDGIKAFERNDFNFILGWYLIFSRLSKTMRSGRIDAYSYNCFTSHEGQESVIMRNG